MSEHEIKTRFGPIEAIKWRLMPGEIITLPWPNVKEFTVAHNSLYWKDLGGAMNVVVATDSPNLHYRPYLEESIGKQGRDWMWRHVSGGSVFVDPQFHRDIDRVQIKIHKRKAKWTNILLLKWGQK